MPKTSPETGGSWGIMGGAFDPIHRGHLKLAEQAFNEFNLDGVLFVVSFDPPHRNKPIASFDNRLKMAGLALEKYDNFILSDIEKEISTPNFTINMINALKFKYPRVNWYLILGEDNLAIFDIWYKPEEIIRQVKVVVGNRPGSAIEKSKWDNKITRFEMTPIDISSTEIRRRIKAGEPVDNMVTDEVAEYIKLERLYL
ncbi:MAG: nicotinate (nicotinamide) nucleotide adenylyltransferase [Candidatus Zixiibacteriota bacterium]